MKMACDTVVLRAVPSRWAEGPPFSGRGSRKRADDGPPEMSNVPDRASVRRVTVAAGVPEARAQARTAELPDSISQVADHLMTLNLGRTDFPTSG